MTVKIQLTEAAFQRQVTELAEYNGWAWMHLERGQNRGAWMTPVSGPLGKGWPDLVLLKGHRILFVELKSDKGLTSVNQREILKSLSRTGHPAMVWRPVDWPTIVDVLTGD